MRVLSRLVVATAMTLLPVAMLVLVTGCSLEPAASTRLDGEPSNGAAMTAPEQPGPLPAAMTRDAGSPTAADAAFSSLPGNTGGNPTPTPVAPPTPTPTQPPVAVPSNDPYEAARAFCVDRINQYRATLGLPALMRAPYAEACVDKQAQYDSAANTAHGAFAGCGELAQNECPGWGGALSSALPGCLASMWSEGPGGGHYENMTSRSYQYVACGIMQSSNGWWVVQDFR